MKLYIKANNLKILKNIDTLMPYAQAKTEYVIDDSSSFEYKLNIQSANCLQNSRTKLFFSELPLSRLVKGVYFGNSSCEHLLPNMHEVVEAKEFCKKRHYNFVFVFPPLSNHYMQDAKLILSYLNNSSCTEVVANDIGTLQLIRKYQNLKPILGINFTKIIKNAFIDTITPTEISNTQLQNQKNLLSHIEIESPTLRAWYKSKNISRFSIENIDIDLSFLDQAPYMQCDFYYPTVTLAHSKACDIAGIFEDERGYFVHKECPKYCNYISLEFAHTKTLGIRQRYNTLYKTNTMLELSEIVYKKSKNRLIWEIFL